jgi:hypothetical protein
MGGEDWAALQRVLAALIMRDCMLDVAAGSVQHQRQQLMTYYTHFGQPAASKPHLVAA